MAHVIEGTWEEIKAHEAEFAGHRVRLIVDPDVPMIVQDRAHLIEELLAADDSPVEERSEERRVGKECRP